MEIGGAIKALRQEQVLSLDLLAGRSGVSRAMLSEIERGMKNPTVRIVMQIAAALGTTVAALIGESPTPETPAPIIIRRADRSTLVEPATGATRQALSPAYAALGVETLWYTLPPEQETAALPATQAGAVAQIVVFWGRLVCAFADRQMVLDEGDSAFFPAGLPQTVRNPDAAPCEFLLINDIRPLNSDGHELSALSTQ
jgi:transcriptional regulator with XRE-family HTH domain